MQDIYLTAIKAAIEGGAEIMKIYENEDFQGETKEDIGLQFLQWELK